MLCLLCPAGMFIYFFLHIKKLLCEGNKNQKMFYYQIDECFHWELRVCHFKENLTNHQPGFSLKAIRTFAQTYKMCGLIWLVLRSLSAVTLADVSARIFSSIALFTKRGTQPQNRDYTYVWHMYAIYFHMHITLMYIYALS